MFRVNFETGEIVMNVGDTGCFEVKGEREDLLPWTDDDRAVFTVRNAAGDNVITRVYGLNDEELGNGVVLIQFHNNDTDGLEPGSYSWELRFVVNPYYDGDTIVDGDVVRTPGADGNGDPMPMTLKGVQAFI